jgi:hypothetical protein
MKIAIIGLGGTGQWLASLLGRTLTEDDELMLMDNDKFEEKNMDRQLNCRVGTYKVAAAEKSLCRASRCRILAIPVWAPCEAMDECDIVFCCADNHAARLGCIQWADADLTRTAFIGGNGYVDADAYVYKGKWKETNMDPREYFPEILTDRSGSPLHPSCTGEVLESEPQLAIANMTLATFMARLYWFWTQTVPTFDVADLPELKKTFPYRYDTASGNINVYKIGE